MAARFFEDAPPGRPERSQQHRRNHQGQHTLEQHEEDPEGQPRHDRGGIALDSGDVGDGSQEALGCGRRGRSRRERGGGQRDDDPGEQEPGESGEPDQQRLVLPLEEDRHHDQTGQAVRTQYVTEPEQCGMDGPEDQQPEVALLQQAPGRLGRQAGRHLARVELHHAVAEQEREHRVDPRVDEGHDQQLGDLVGDRATLGVDRRQTPPCGRRGTTACWPERSSAASRPGPGPGRGLVRRLGPGRAGWSSRRQSSPSTLTADQPGLPAIAVPPPGVAYGRGQLTRRAGQRLQHRGDLVDGEPPGQGDVRTPRAVVEASRIHDPGKDQKPLAAAPRARPRPRPGGPRCSEIGVARRAARRRSPAPGGDRRTDRAAPPPSLSSAPGRPTA